MARGFSEKESRGWDSTVEALAYLGLLSAGAYAGVKHFPSITLKRALTRMSSHLRGVRGRTSNLTGNFHRTFGTQQVPSPLWKTSRPQDLTLLHEMQTAIDVFKGESRISGSSVDAVSRSLMSRYAADVPQAAGSMNPMTVRQLLKGTGMAELRAHVGDEAVGQLQDSIKHLVRLPGFRQSLARQGLTEAQFLGRVPVGAFMMVSPKTKEVMGVRGGLRALLEDVADVRIPFTNFKPFGLLIPDLSPKPGTTFLGGRAAKAMFGAKDALFVDGSVYPLRGERELLMGRAEVGYRLATTRQVGAARAAAARMGLLKPSFGEGRAERLARTRQQPRWRRQLNILSRRAGVGPQWAGRRSVAENVYGRLRAIARGAEPKYPGPAGVPAAGITPEGAWLRELTKRPSMAVSSMADLSVMERIRLRLGSRISRAFYEDGKFLKREVALLPGVKRSAKNLLSPFGRGVEYYASQGRGVSDWANNQITRPLWMLAEMTGLGMKPGRSPLESLGQIGLKLAAPAYVGYQALEYAEYKTNRWLGFGPITGPAALYTHARVGAQHALDAVGVTDFLQNMEEQYPGSIESPVSRGLRGAGTVLGSMFLAGRIAHPYAKAAAMAGGSVLGWLQLAGINKPADELTRIYEGKQDVPVRASRGWFLGRASYAGNKIKYFEPSWYHRLRTRPKEIGLYGSRQQAWRGSWLPTPENWMLIKNVMDPYYLERQAYHTRPYPSTAGIGGSVPIVGPIVSNTVGRLIKPVQRREVPVGAETSTPSTNDYEQAIALGLGGPVARVEGRVASRLALLTGDTIYRVFDWTGLPGFMVGAMREQLTGKTGWYLDQKAEATSGAMTSASRDWYDRNAGGAFGLCFVAGTQVATETGRRPIEDVAQGDLVVSGDGSLRRVTGTLKKKSSDLVRLKVANLSSEVVGTSTHHIPVYKFYPCHNKNSQPCVPNTRKHCQKCTKRCKTITTQDLALQDIRPGDWVCTPIRTFGDKQLVVDLAEFTDRACTGEWIYYRASQESAEVYGILEQRPETTRAQLREMGFNDRTAKEISYAFRHDKIRRFRRHVTVTPEIAYVLGWWVAEGSIEDNGRVIFTMGDQDLSYVPEIQQIIKEEFGADVVLIPGNGNGFALRVQCIPLALLARSLFGHGAANKLVPERVKQMPREELKQFFRGAVLGDGWSNPDKGGFTSASGDLCRDLFDIGLMFNLLGNVHIDYTERGTGYYPQGTPRKDSIRSYIHWNTSAEILYEIMYGDSVEPIKHKPRSFIHGGLYFVKVLECERVSSGEVDVYDLQVEDLHYYIANHILVHNTEFFRRFVPNDQQRLRLNPLANRTPRWLPGQSSVFKGDRENYINFHTGDPYCVSACTPICCGNSYKLAADVRPGDTITTHKGRKLPVRNVLRREMRDGEKAYRLRLSGVGGFVEMVFSEEHPLFIRRQGYCSFGSSSVCRSVRNWNGFCDDKRKPKPWRDRDRCSTGCKDTWTGSAPEFIRVDRCRPGDYVAYKIPTRTLCTTINYQWPECTNKYRSEYTTRAGSLLLTADLAWLFGLYTAEGYVSGSRKYPSQLSLAMCADEIHILEKANDLLDRYFGVRGTISVADNNAVLVVSSSRVARIFEFLLPGNSHTKQIPEFMFHAPFDAAWAFVCGMILGDGHVAQRRTLGYTTAGRDLAFGLRSLCFHLGIPLSISRRVREDPRLKDGVSTSYELGTHVFHVRDLDLSYLCYKKDQIDLDFKQQPHVDNFSDGEYIYQRIRAIEETSIDEVYGFEVDEDDSFCVMNFATHNTKIEKGEMRLPGAGWDAVHKGVENKTPGMYSALDRFQILGDVAPNSQAYKHYRKMVEGQIALGTLKKQDIGRFVQTQDQVAEQMKSRVGTGGYRYGFGEFREQEVTIEDTGLTTFTTHQHPGMQFHLAGVEGRTYALEGAHDRFGKLRRRMAELRGKTLPMVYGGFGPTTPAILGDANEWAIDAGLGKTRSVSDLDFRAKHGTNMFRHSYEWLMHTTLPGPLNWPRSKWIGQMSPIEEYEAFTERGSLDTGWEHPVQNYLTPWFNQFFGSTSSAQLETRRINEYTDHFKFAKYSRLQARAEAMGDMGMANQFAREAGQTLVAADPMAPSFYRDIFGALPPSERPYFAAFAGVTSEARQERILRAVPENLKPTYIGVWERQAGTAGFDSPVLQRYAEEMAGHYETRPEDRVAQYFAHQPLPEASYSGWDPGVDPDTIRIKMAEDEGLDVHEMRMWEPQRIEAASYEFGAPQRQPEMSREELLELLRRRGYSNMRSVQGFPGDPNRFNFRRSRMRRWQQVQNNMALQGAA